MLALFYKMCLLSLLTAGMFVISGCGSSNSPEQRRVSSNPFAPADNNTISSRTTQSAPSRPVVTSPNPSVSATDAADKMEGEAETAPDRPDLITETSKYTLDSEHPGVAVIVKGISDKIPEAAPLIKQKLTSLVEAQKQQPDAATAPQFEQHVIDQQLVLIVRPVPEDLFAFSQKLNCGAIKEIDIQKRIITVEAQLPQLMALAQGDLPGKAGMDADVKVSANSDSLRNMKSAATVPPAGKQPEKQPLPNTTIGTDRDLKPRAGEETIDWALRVIAGSSSFAHDTACKKLAEMKPDSENLNRVSALLAATLPLAKQGFRMPEHVNAMAVWYTDDATREFAKLLEEEKDFLVREKIIDLLPDIHSEITAEVLVGRLSNRKDMRAARRSLQFLGEIAEPPVILLLNNDEVSLRIEACNILQSIGTAKAIPALKLRIETEDNDVVKQQLVKTEAMIQKKIASDGN